MKTPFLRELFFKSLDDHRLSKKYTWKKVAEQADVSASTLTRIAQGKRPDVDTLAALCRWAGLNADDFIAHSSTKVKAEHLSEIMAHLRADKNISPEGAIAIEVMIKAAYSQFRMEQ